MTHQHAAEILQSGEETLDLPAPLIATLRTAILRLGFAGEGAVAACRRYDEDADDAALLPPGLWPK